MLCTVPLVFLASPLPPSSLSFFLFPPFSPPSLPFLTLSYISSTCRPPQRAWARRVRGGEGWSGAWAAQEDQHTKTNERIALGEREAGSGSEKDTNKGQQEAPAPPCCPMRRVAGPSKRLYLGPSKMLTFIRILFGHVWF